MHFVITAFDKENSLDLRMSTRAKHLEYAKENNCTVIGGPLLTEGDDPKPKGSVIIIEVDNLAAAKKYAENDPYALAGLFEKVSVRPWAAAIGKWLPKGD